MVYKNEDRDYALLDKAIDKIKTKISGIKVLRKNHYFIFETAVLDFTVDKCKGWVFRLWPKYDEETKTNIVDYLILGEHFEFLRNEFLDKFKPNNTYLQINSINMDEFINAINFINKYPRHSFVASLNKIKKISNIPINNSMVDYVNREYNEYMTIKRKRQQLYQKIYYNMLNNFTKEILKIEGVTCVGYIDYGNKLNPRYELEISTCYEKSNNNVKKIGEKINEAIIKYNANYIDKYHENSNDYSVANKLRLPLLRVIQVSEKAIIKECKYIYR